MKKCNNGIKKSLDLAREMLTLSDGKENNSDSGSSGERTRKSPNRLRVSMQALRRRGRGSHRSGLRTRHRVTKPTVSGTVWKGRRYRVIAPYAKVDWSLSGVPKYSGARETLLEFAATMR